MSTRIYGPHPCRSCGTIITHTRAVCIDCWGNPEITLIRPDTPYRTVADIRECPKCGDRFLRILEHEVGVLCTIGHSTGGLIAGGVAFRYPELAQGYALISSGGDWEAIYALASPRLQQQLERSMGGTPETAEEEYRARSLIWQVDSVTRPILVQHGTADPIVPVALSVELVQALHGDSHEPTTFFYPEGSHGLWWTTPEAWADFLQWLSVQRI